MKKNIISVISVIVLIVIGVIFYNMLFSKNAGTDIGAIKDSVTSGEYDFSEGKKLMDNEKYPEAEKHFVEVLKHKNTLSKESYINTLVNLGVCCANQQKLNEAEKYWQQAADLGDKDAANNLKLLHNPK